MIRSSFVECLGTYFFFLVIGLVVATDVGPLGPLAIALTLAINIYATGHISGGNLNPAVSLGLLIRGVLPAKKAAVYIVSQAVGASLAALSLHLLVPAAKLAALAPLTYPETVPVLAAEFLFTFFLVWMVMNVATAKANANNSFYGLAIGGTVLAGAVTVGGISGGMFNPAVLTGLVVMGKLPVGLAVPPLVAQFAAGAAAALAFRFASDNEPA